MELFNQETLLQIKESSKQYLPQGLVSLKTGKIEGFAQRPTLEFGILDPLTQKNLRQIKNPQIRFQKKQNSQIQLLSENTTQMLNKSRMRIQEGLRNSNQIQSKRLNKIVRPLVVIRFGGKKIKIKLEIKIKIKMKFKKISRFLKNRICKIQIQIKISFKLKTLKLKFRHRVYQKARLIKTAIICLKIFVKINQNCQKKFKFKLI